MSNKVPSIYDDNWDGLCYDSILKEYRKTLRSCPKDKGWRTELVNGPDGWLSPRMSELLIITADSSSDDNFLDESSLIFGSAKRYLSSFREVLYAIARSVETGSLTTSSISARIGRGAKKYLENGGSIEAALDFVLRAAKISLDDGEFDEIIEDDEETRNLPVTPLDDNFDLVRIMSMNKRCFR